MTIMTRPVFSHGQLCVAFGRTRNELNLKLQIDDCEERVKLKFTALNKKCDTERSTAVNIFAALTISVTIWIYFI